MTYATAGLKSGDKIGNCTIYVDFVKLGNHEIRPGTKMVPKFTTTHNTGNPGRGANAKAHNNLMHNMAGKPVRDTSHIGWHVSVDEHEAYIHIPFDEPAYHCGDGSGPGNSSSIGFEICMHSDQKNYQQAEENAKAIIAHVLRYYGLTYDKNKPHQYWSGKYCPAVILKRDGSFKPFNESLRRMMEQPQNEVIVQPEVDNGTLVLPANISSWAVYKHSVGTFDKTIVGYLNPKRYGGLSYKVINSPFPNYFAIRTEKFGIVNILADGKRGEYWIQPPKKVEAPQPISTPTPQPSKKYLKLPATATSWSIYPLNKPPVKANAVGSLNPKKHGGLTYEILGNPQAHVYTIQTRDFGKVNIYAAPSTGAIIN